MRLLKSFIFIVISFYFLFFSEFLMASCLFKLLYIRVNKANVGELSGDLKILDYQAYNPSMVDWRSPSVKGASISENPVDIRFSLNYEPASLIVRIGDGKDNECSYVTRIRCGFSPPNPPVWNGEIRTNKGNIKCSVKEYENSAIIDVNG